MIANINRAIVQTDIARRVNVYDKQRQTEIVSGKVITEHKIPLYYET